MMAVSDSLSDRVREMTNRISESGAPALSGLFDLTAHRLHRYAVTITRNQHDAEDVVQAVLVQVAGKPGLLSQADHPWHYLLQMVRNRAILVTRNRKRTFSVTNLYDLITRRSVDEVDLEETHREVWTALRKLPSNQREVVVLKIWEELTFAQIASILELTPSTVASRYRYAMTKLSRHLQANRPEVPHE
ncbi:MAG: sigma-70 family RNA polymerase sigma factor [Pirellulaceae bacterium]|nr:sigma-70 family RNA polymerase sigma factor [Pirellulaceae bacterium]